MSEPIINYSQIAGVDCLCLSLQDALTGRSQLTVSLIEQLLNTLQHDQQTRFIVLQGTKDAFCKGLALDQVIANDADDSVSEARHVLIKYAELLTTLANTGQFVIAKVNGNAMGGGVGLAAVADLVLATPQAQFSLPETVVGLIPGIVFPYLAARIGVSQSRLLAIGGAPLTAVKAQQLGLVDEVTDDLEKTMKRFIGRLCRMDARAVGRMKRLISKYFITPSAYQEEAITIFGDLIGSQQTRARITRLLNGDIPWEHASDEQ